MSNNKQMFVGRVKNVKPYPEGRTSLLVVVNQIGDDKIVPMHVNLCISSSDVERENIKYASIVAFEAVGMQEWRVGQDRFLGTRMSNDKNETHKYNLPALSEDPHPKLGPVGTWADQEYLLKAGIREDLYLKADVTPIYALVGFNPLSVALHESYKPAQTVKLVAQQAAEKSFRPTAVTEPLDKSVQV